MRALYSYDGKMISEEDFQDALTDLGIVKGDIIMVHSDIKVFGRIATDAISVMESLVTVLERQVGDDGTIIMPTFTYSFCRREPFDRASSPSTVGSLTEYFRQQPDVARTLHPLFSVAVRGKHADTILDIRKDSFGAGTIFDTLRRLHGKIIFLGASFAESCTFLHHIEQMHRVPYRFMKPFSGTIIDGNRTYEDTYTFFVRPLDGSVESDMARIEPALRRSGVFREAKVGNGTIALVDSNVLFEVVTRLMDENPYVLLTDGKQPAIV